MMGTVDYIVIGVLAVIIGLALYFALKNRKKGCGGDCAHCMMNCDKKNES